MTFLLTGIRNQANLYSTLRCEADAANNITCRIRSSKNIINLLSCAPLVSTVIGIPRALLGAAYAIKHLACAFFSNNKIVHTKKAEVGIKNFGRGLIATAPVIGNLLSLKLLLKEQKHYEGLIKGYFRANPALCLNNTITFYDGRVVDERLLDLPEQNALLYSQGKEKVIYYN